MGWWLVGSAAPVALVVLFVLWWRSGTAFYRRLYGMEHRIELAQRIAELKRSALAELAPESRTATDNAPNRVVTSLGLVVVYTIEPAPEEGFTVHHLSVSMVNTERPPTHATGRLFTAALLRLLALPPDGAECWISPNMVHHTLLGLDQEAHAAASAQPVPALTMADAPAFYDESRQLAQRMEWQRLPPGVSL